MVDRVLSPCLQTAMVELLTLRAYYQSGDMENWGKARHLMQNCDDKVTECDRDVIPVYYAFSKIIMPFLAHTSPPFGVFMR